ncbi:hypothetical protein D3C83_48730 [compost metagenome]
MYSLKQLRMYSVSPSNTTNTPKRMSYGIARPSFSSEEITSTWPLWCRCPPSATGRITLGISSTLAGGNSNPYGAGVRPVALQTAVLSIAGLEPSRKELNIFGFRPPTFACSGVRP